MNDDRFDSTQDDILRYFNSETAHAGDEHMSTGQLMHGLFAHHVAKSGGVLIRARGRGDRLTVGGSKDFHRCRESCLTLTTTVAAERRPWDWMLRVVENCDSHYSERRRRIKHFSYDRLVPMLEGAIRKYRASFDLYSYV